MEKEKQVNMMENEKMKPMKVKSKMEMETTNNEKQTLNLKGNRKNINLYN
jgi:hypothetical protein